MSLVIHFDLTAASLSFSLARFVHFGDILNNNQFPLAQSHHHYHYNSGLLLIFGHDQPQ